MEEEGYSKEEMEEILKEDTKIIKKTKIVSDGVNLLVRIPKQISNEANIKKGEAILWVYDTIEKRLYIKIDQNEKKTTS